MGQARQHPGHSADARRRIEEAREHYACRKERRGYNQVWMSSDGEPIRASDGHVEDAVPIRVSS